MKRLFTFILTIALTTLVMAQSKADAERYFNAGNYAAAKEVYAKLLTKKPNDALLNYCYARCLYEEGNISAIGFFNEVTKKYPESYRYMGNLYFRDYQFAEAEEAYSAYMDATSMNADIAYLQAKSSIGADLLKHVEDIEVIDSIIVDKESFLKQYVLPQEAGSISRTATSSYAYTTERNDRKFYSELVDGQSDILYTYRLLGEWSAPSSISDNINTDANEDFPFMMADGITFYFASDKEEGLGGYDIYMTRFNSNTNDYLPPQNIGMPFNSPANDYLFAVNEINGIGYFATDRYLPEDKVCIYRFLFHREKQMLKDVDYTTLRRRAQLLQTHHVAAPVVENVTPSNQTASESSSSDDTEINFVVNTSVTYKHLNEFKSERTKNLYLELQELIHDHAALQQDIASTRERFATANEKEKEELTIQILTSERVLASMQLLIHKQTIALRNEETKLIDAAE